MFLSTFFKRLGYLVSLFMLALFGGCAHWGAQSVTAPDCSQCAATARTTTPTYGSTPIYSAPTPEPMVETTYYTVRTGDTIYNLATHYETSVEELAQWNGLTSPYKLSPGQRILVPAGYPLPTVPVATTRPVPNSPSPKPSPVSSQPGSTWDTAGGVYHVVEPGETLYSIAKNYGKHYLDVAQWNNIPSPYQISVGQRLLVSQTNLATPPPSTYTPSPVVSQPTVTPVTQPMFDGNYYVVQPGETLYSIARRYSYSVNDIAAWNGILPPYNLSVGQRLIVMPPNGVMPPSNPPIITPSQPPVAVSIPPSGYHTVALGETLYSIARLYGHNVSQLASWNGLQPPYTLSVGQNVIVDKPNNSSLSMRSLSYQMVPIASSVPISSSSVPVGYHVVGRGETLYSIAKSYGYSVSQVAQWNNLRAPYILSVGQRLKVSPSGNSPQNYYKSSSSIASSSDYHIVAPGENLYRISKRYGVTVDDLMRWNNIYSPQSLRVGQRLQLYSSTSSSSAGYSSASSVRSMTYYSAPTTYSVPTTVYTQQPTNTYSIQGTSTNHYVIPTTQPRYQTTYTPTVQRAPRFHVVEAGETLAGIAAKYGLTSHELALFNGIGQPYTIYPGQQVLIP